MSDMRLFDVLNRNDLRAKTRSEPIYEYLNATGHPECARIRDVLEEWFRSFPDCGKSDVCARFRNKDDRQHLSAFFELYLHALLTRAGFVAESHPLIPHSSAHPDFRFVKDADAFYLEAVTVAEAEGQLVESPVLSRLLDYIDANISSPDFYLLARTDAPPPTRLSHKKLVEFLKTELGKLDWVQIIAHAEQDPRVLPLIRYESRGWRIEFSVVPRSRQSRESAAGRIIGGGPFIIGWSRIGERIRSAVKTKAQKYRDLHSPFVVAVNVLGPAYDALDVANALFGDEVVIVDVGTQEHKLAREPNGVFVSASAPRYTRLSAVLLVEMARPTTLAVSGCRLWHNPWAKYPLDASLLPFPQTRASLDTGTLIDVAGISPQQVLGITRDWP